MRVRQLPHFAHSPIGKSTHVKGKSYSHVNYIGREDACSKILSGNMPDDLKGARPYFEREANKEGMPENGRVADTFIIALPIEMTAEQRHDAIHGFMDKIGQGRIAWLAAFHDKGEDAHNPHCHLMFRDADIETGKKVVGTTTSSKDVREAEERGWRVPPRMTTKDLRVAWTDHLNAEMERHGYDVRFDQRRLKEQGIDREAQIHVGPKAKSMAERGKEFESRDTNHGDHSNIYTLLDAGSREEHNNRIIAENKQREAARAERDAEFRARETGPEAREKRELRETQSAARKEMWGEQKEDRQALREAHAAQKLEHQRWARKLYADAREKAFKEVKASQADRWKRIRAIKFTKRRNVAVEAMKVRQKSLYAAAAAAHVEKARPVRNEAWHTLKAAQEKERRALQQHHREESKAQARHHVAEQLAVAETWRAHHLARAAAGLGNDPRQDMASVQAQAVRQMKMHKRAASSMGRDVPMPQNPLAAVKAYAETSRAAVEEQRKIRAALRAGRQENLIRSGGPATRRTKPGRHAENRSAAAMAAVADQAQWQKKKDAEAAATKPSSRQPGATFDACLKRLAASASEQQREEMSRNRQAAESGQSMTDANRLNASPEVRRKLDNKDRSSRFQQRFDRFVSQKSSDKGRDGGGRSGR